MSKEIVSPCPSSCVTSCAYPTTGVSAGYVASIYQGPKDVDDKENLATGVTAVEVSNATGSGTVTVSVDGVALTPAFDTTNDTERFWIVSGTEVSWVMSGVTDFELGQGVT